MAMAYNTGSSRACIHVLHYSWLMTAAASYSIMMSKQPKTGPNAVLANHSVDCSTMVELGARRMAHVGRVICSEFVQV